MMRTDDLVHALAADLATPARPVGRYLATAVAPAWVISAVLFAVALGPREDFTIAVGQPRFVLKLVVTLLLAVSASMLVLRLARPVAEGRLPMLALTGGPALLAIAVLVELVSVPPSEWTTRLVGSNYLVCLTAVPLLGLPPLAAALVALRHGAPTRPMLAGAIAGVLAGGLAAALYAMHCSDDSPLFVATWYALAIVILALIGAVAGRQFLRW